MLNSVPSPAEIEEALLRLVADETGESIEKLRADAIAYPYDPPWDSRVFVILHFKIEEAFDIAFDIFAAERASRRLNTMVALIRSMLVAKLAETA